MSLKSMCILNTKLPDNFNFHAKKPHTGFKGTLLIQWWHNMLRTATKRLYPHFHILVPFSLSHTHIFEPKFTKVTLKATEEKIRACSISLCTNVTEFFLILHNRSYAISIILTIFIRIFRKRMWERWYLR